MSTQRWLSGRVIGLAWLLVAAVLVLSGCAPAGGAAGPLGNPDNPDDEQPGKFAPQSTMAMIQQRGRLIVGTDFTTAPFSFKDPNTGSPSGFDAEVVKQIAIGIFGSQVEGKIDWVSLDPRDRERALSQSKVDIAVGRYEITVNRKTFVDFAGPYYIAHQGVVFMSDNGETGGDGPVIASLLDLNGKKVCTVRGSTNYLQLKAVAPGADTTIVLTSAAACAANVLAGNSKAVVADTVDEIPLTQGNSTQTLQALPATFGATPYGVGIKKGTDDLRQFVNDRLTKWQTYTEAFQRTVGAPTGADTMPPPVDRY